MGDFVTKTDLRALSDTRQALVRLAREFPVEMAQQLNREGRILRRALIDTEAKQTGLGARLLRKALREKPANPWALVYTITASGGDVGLGYFRPREVGRGVVAYPMGAARTVDGGFTMGGGKAHRVVLRTGLRGSVFTRVHGARRLIRGVKSGVFVAEQMLEGQTGSVATHGVNLAASNLVRRIDRMTGEVIG